MAFSCNFRRKHAKIEHMSDEELTKAMIILMNTVNVMDDFFFYEPFVFAELS